MNRITAIIALLGLAACAPAPVRDGQNFDPDNPIVWPGPPQKARIRFLYSITEPRDLGISPGLMKRFVQFFAGRTSDAMLRPYAVAADADLIAVADPGLRLVHLFRIKESRYDVIRDAGDESLQSPVGISISTDSIFVADSSAAKVFVFDRNGELKNSIQGPDRPTGIVFHPSSGNLYVTDTLANKVFVFDQRGNLLTEFGTRGIAHGEFNFPTSLALNDDTLLVNDTLNYRIQAFSLDGEPISAFGENGDGSGQFALSKGLATDTEGHIYIADALSNFVQVFDMEGRFLLGFGGMGGEPGQFRLPAGIHSFGNTIYIADSQNGRIQVFEFLGGET
jgi:DNA-binding beta-propeller fold protein YncE